MMIQTINVTPSTITLDENREQMGKDLALPVFTIWSVTGTYYLISPIQAPFLCSGRLFDINSGKTSTIVLGSPRFSVHLVIGGYIAAGNDR
jgi:hypothetical protein